MTVVVLTAVPVGLRGHLTRWLLEVAPGTYVGHVSARIRDHLWDIIVEMVGTGKALMVHTARNEQRLAFRTHNHDWTPEDFDGITLMRRRAPLDVNGRPERKGWSLASRRRSAQRFSGSTTSDKKGEFPVDF